MTQDLEDWSLYTDETRRQVAIFTNDLHTAIIQGGTGK